jgi:preprotein translocase subunit YajC
MTQWIAIGSALIAAVPALAETAPAAPAQQGVAPFVPLILMGAIFYFLIIRPQQKKQKLHAQFLTELKRGDMVVTSSGIIGTIKTLSEKFVTLEIDEGVCLKLLRAQVAEGANNLKEETKPKA